MFYLAFCKKIKHKLTKALDILSTKNKHKKDFNNKWSESNHSHQNHVAEIKILF